MKPKLFNETQALEKAMKLFWQHGFDGTSMQMLQDELEISRASIYHTFESKNELFRRALKQYLLRARERYQACLSSSDDLIEALTCLCKAIAQGDRAYPGGCLLVLSTLEISQHEPATQEIIKMAHANRHKTLANKLKETGISHYNEKAQILCALLNGLSVMNKAGQRVSEETLKTLLEFLKE